MFEIVNVKRSCRDVRNADQPILGGSESAAHPENNKNNNVKPNHNPKRIYGTSQASFRKSQQTTLYLLLLIFIYCILKSPELLRFDKPKYFLKIRTN